MTLFFPISKIIENSSNTFSMYLKISSGSAKIGEAQIRATISGQGLAAGLGDWNGRININENIGYISITDVPFVADVFKDTVSVTFPSQKTQGLTQTIGNIPITDQNYDADAFTDRAWITEILRTFVLTSVRGNPKYKPCVHSICVDVVTALILKYGPAIKRKWILREWIKNIQADCFWRS